MKAAISGSHGHIGTRLSEVLKERGYEVVPISQEVLYDQLELRKFFEYHKPELIFHLATYGNLHKHTHPSKVVHANIMGAFNMLRESSNINYKAFINIGTSSEYGRKDKPMAEGDILAPETFYAATKAAATQLAHAFATQYKKPILTIRPFSVYGPAEKNEHFIPVLIKNILGGKLTGVEKNALHDWIYIDDLIDGMLFAVDHIKDIPGRVINIGTGKAYSNKEICDLLQDISGKIPLIAPLENLRPVDSAIWVCDTSLMKNLGWEPQTRLRHGLFKTYEWYKAHDKF